MTQGDSIVIMHPSAVIAAGLRAVIEPALAVTCLTLRPDNLSAYLPSRRPAALLADPLTADAATVASIRRLSDTTAVLAVTAGRLPDEVTARFDSVLSLYDGPDSIAAAVRRAMAGREAPAQDRRSCDRSPDLTPRERDVLVGVVKGLSNKEIATEINVSANTVMTHRRNIAAKLGIHSTAGLTIYAIVTKLVRIEDLSPGAVTS